MLENAWIIPATPFVSFWIILFLGKRLPRGGSEIGVTALALSFVLSCVAVYQWVDRPADTIIKPAADSHTAEVEHGTPPFAEMEEIEEGHSLGVRVVPTSAEGGAGEHDAEGGAGEHEVGPIRAAVDRSTTWFKLGPLDVKAGTHIDGLAVTMLFVVTLISLLVHIFATNYMHGDVRFTHFFAALSLFTTGMLVLVVSSTTLQMLFGWELMGLCSFMLIGHWWEKKENSNAAMKAFLTTRTGDIGLLVGISTLFFAAGGSFDIATINAAALAGDMSETALKVGAFALLLAVIGKSAQFPLHTWLPDAMAGPTPVSALIHAATMVVAGVYLVARLYGVFWEGFDISAGGANPVAIVGGITVVIAALLAFVQNDIKKVLAYSTVSQLGYMVLALGVGAWTAALFHLFTHAFFKALLFLGSGSVSHAVHSFDMRKDMGGLRTYMPTTFATFMIGSVALAGVFPFAGFWSKDEILLGAGENGYEFFMYVGLLGAFMTAAYMSRCVYLTFFGSYRGHGHPHESPKTITMPLIVLAVFSVGAGWLNAPFLDYWFGEVTTNETAVMAGLAHHPFEVGAALVSTAVVLVALAVGFVAFFLDKLPTGVTQRNALARVGYRVLDNKYYLDRLYTDWIVGSLKGSIAKAAYWINQRVLDGVVNAVGVGAKRLGRWVYDTIDQGLVDGVVNGAGSGAEGAGGALRTIQSGRVQQYGAMLFGAATVFAFVLAILAV